MATRKEKKRGGKRRKSRAARADRHDLYERAVQCVEHEIDFVDATFTALRGRQAGALREDFCGTANCACEWVRRRPGNVAVGVDLDAEVLAWGRARHVAALQPGARQRIRLVHGDVMSIETPPQDAVLAMNFSYWLLRERAQLRGYFARVHAALAGDGVFFLDAFGGYDAFRVLKERTTHDDFTYVWHQAAYNPVDGDMTCHIHFEFDDGSRLKKAFSYHWRLWTLPEIREVLGEAGFAQTTVYWQGWNEDESEGDSLFVPVERGDADAGWIAYIVARK